MTMSLPRKRASAETVLSTMRAVREEDTNWREG